MRSSSTMSASLTCKPFSVTEVIEGLEDQGYQLLASLDGLYAKA
jgi:hypothetical protein